MKKRLLVNNYLILSLTILLAVFLRAYNLSGRGLIYHDEGYYANAAKTVYYSLEWIITHEKDIKKRDYSTSTIQDYLRIHGCSNPKDKPGHILILSLGFFLFGLKEYSPLIIGSFFGSLTVFWLYLFGKKRLGEMWTLFSIIFLAVSYLHLHYSRSALYIDSVFFAFLAMHLYLWSIDDNRLAQFKWMALLGLLTGFCFTMDQKSIFIVLTICATELFLFFVSPNRRYLILLGRLGSLSLFFTVFNIVVEGVFWLVFGFFLENPEYYQSYLSYFLGSKVRLLESSYVSNLSYVFFYPSMLFEIEGCIFSIFLGIGLICFIYSVFRTKDPLYFFCSFLWLASVTFWTVRSGGHPSVKVIPLLLPTGAIMAGYFFSRMNDYLINIGVKQTKCNVIVVLLMMTISSYGIINGYDLITIKNRYHYVSKQLKDYIKKNGGKINASQQGSFSPLAVFYLGLELEEDNSLMNNIVLHDEEGINTDYFFATWHNYGKAKNLALVKRSKEEGVEIIKVEDNVIKRLPRVLLNLRGGSVMIERVLNPLRKYPDFKYIVIYDLRK